MDGLADYDVVQLTRLFLGRDPGSEAEVASRVGAPLLPLLREFTASAEFRLKLQAPIEALRLPDVAAMQIPAGATAGWAATALPMDDAARPHVAAQRSWAGLYAALFGQETFRREVEGVNPRAGAAAFGDACRALADALEGRSLAGGVEAFGREEVRGWIVDRARLDEGVEVELLVGGRPAARTSTRLFRRDLQDAMGGPGRYGFAFLAGEDGAPAGFGDALEVRDVRSGVVIAAARLDAAPDPGPIARFRADVSRAEAALASLSRRAAELGAAATFPLSEYGAWAQAYGVETFRAERARAEAALGWAETPRLGLLVGPAAAPLDHLPLLAALERQEVAGWSALLLAPPADAVRTQALVDGLPPSVQARCRVLATPLGLDGIGRVELAELDGGHVLLLDGGDSLASDALFRLGSALRGPAPPHLAYGDDDRFEADGRDGLLRSQPRLRGAFDPDLLLQTDALGPVLCIRRQELETALRLTEIVAPDRITHLAGVLSHLRDGDALSDRLRAQLAADVSAHLQRTGSAAEVELAPDPLGADRRGAVRIRRRAPAHATATVIIPTRDRLDLLAPCLASLERHRADNVVRMEVVVVDNGSREPAVLEHLARAERQGSARVVRSDAPFNFAALNNLAARTSGADLLVMLNNDVEVLTAGWLDALAAHAMRSEVGAVGARLVYGDLTIQHAGVVTGGVHELTAHEGVGVPAADGGYMGRHALTRRVAAVTGACLATRREVWERLGGLDAARFAVDGNDVDYCLRVGAAGLAVLYTPDCTLFHHESKSRGFNVRSEEARRRGEEETARLKARWGGLLMRDPWYPDVFDRGARPLQRLGPPPSRRDGP